MRILLITGPRHHEIEKPLCQAGIDYEVVFWNYKEVKRLVRYGNLLLSVLHILRTIQRGKYDVVMSESDGFLALLGLILSKFLDIPFIMRLRGDPIAILTDAIQKENSICKKFFYKAIGKLDSYCLTRADGIISVSRHLSRVLQKTLKIPPERIQIVYLPYSPDKWDESRISYTHSERDQPVILTVTSFGTWAKTEALMKALPPIDRFLSQYPGSRLLIAGAGRHLGKIRRWVYANLKNCDRMEILGFVEDIEHLYLSSDIFVYFSNLDGCPNVVLEAQAAALPVVVNDFQPLEEQVEHDRNGFVVSMDCNGVKLYEKLLLLASDARLRQEFGEKGRQKVTRENDPSVIGDRLRSAIFRVLNQTDQSH